MAIIIPIQGLRYNPAKAAKLDEVVTPPYDVIDAAAQEGFYQRHPYNIIRLEYGRILPGDDETNNRYTRASADLSAWLKEEVLVSETAPALYYYEQEFSLAGERVVRSCCICGVRLEPYEKGIVLPHEETMTKHKADRLELMRTCMANFSPVFSLYADQEKMVDRILKQAAGDREPDIHFTGSNGETHRMWVVQDAGAIGKVQEAMAGRRIFIADGHHRYETALNYKRERELSGQRPADRLVSAASSCSTTPQGVSCCSSSADPAYNYVMMTLVNLYDPGLVILPTHRLVKNVTGFNRSKLIEQLKENFSVKEYPLAADRSNLQDFLGVMGEHGKPHPGDIKKNVFGLYTGDNKLYLLSLINERDLAGIMPQDKPPVWQRLDVAVLHTLVIEKYLGICGKLRARAEHITYTQEEEGALAAVDRGEYQLAFFLNPTLVEEVTEVAAQGEKMPQKSTYFYPKFITGLVINPL
ncbi:hypothetical protein Psfp_01587 [Pelotomaculum sp. FP]|uniref:DUF1015 domain-containing protein n=1 Tax=Pelotomaculum sp. FP TaxID=261474 RepID=UPI0010668A4A|nr:DUF1015 domain-containing protein [Pelotomaculum sp. FP]TEB16160.1 hypothetical protein Psfp_01587 [Pelotomaculum sp. FP]